MVFWIGIQLHAISFQKLHLRTLFILQCNSANSNEFLHAFYTAKNENSWKSLLRFLPWINGYHLFCSTLDFKPLGIYWYCHSYYNLYRKDYNLISGVNVLTIAYFGSWASARTLFTFCVSKMEIGKIYASVGIVASVAPLASNPAFRQLYNHVREFLFKMMCAFILTFILLDNQNFSWGSTHLGWLCYFDQNINLPHCLC